MDQGVAAVAAAGMGIGGVVLTAGFALRGARLAAKAQVEAALAGVREQARQEQGIALRAARRTAYSEFLGQIEMARMAIDRALDVSERVVVEIEHHRSTGVPMSSTPDWPTTKARMESAMDDLWFRHSALRLYTDDRIADQAEQLIRTARAAADEFGLVVDAVQEDYSPAEHYASIRASVAELKTGTSAWADAAVASLEQPSL